VPLRTIRSLGEHHLLRTVGACRDARVNVSRRRRLRDAHRIQSSMEMPMPRRRRLMARAPLRMGMKLARLVTVDSMRVCEHDIVLLRYGVTIIGLLLYFARLCAPRLVTLGKGDPLIADAAVLRSLLPVVWFVPWIVPTAMYSLRSQFVRVLYYSLSSVHVILNRVRNLNETARIRLGVRDAPLALALHRDDHAQSRPTNSYTQWASQLSPHNATVFNTQRNRSFPHRSSSPRLFTNATTFLVALLFFTNCIRRAKHTLPHNPTTLRHLSRTTCPRHARSTRPAKTHANGVPFAYTRSGRHDTRR
jgi:hypothetical protein